MRVVNKACTWQRNFVYLFDSDKLLIGWREHHESDMQMRPLTFYSCEEVI